MSTGPYGGMNLGGTILFDIERVKGRDSFFGGLMICLAEMRGRGVEAFPDSLGSARYHIYGVFLNSKSGMMVSTIEFSILDFCICLTMLNDFLVDVPIVGV